MRPFRHLKLLGLSLVCCACGGSAQVAHSPARSPQIESASLDNRIPTGDAHRQMERAIRAVDRGQLDKAIGILVQLHQELPRNTYVLQGLALTYRMHRQPAKAVALLAPLREQLTPELLATYGSALNESGDPKGAEVFLRQALKKHPSSGMLHADLGTLLSNHGRFPEAIEQYELGIRAEPQIASNYHNAARLLANGSRRGMAFIYGEVFRLLEPDTERSREMAKVLVTIAASAVRTENQGGQSKTVISLAPNEVDLAKTPFANVPFENAFELTFGLALAKTRADGLTLSSLHEARALFVPILRDPQTPHSLLSQPLLRWLIALEEAGHLEAYDMWLFGPGLPEQVKLWLQRPEAAGELSAMAKFVVAHPLFPTARFGDPDTI